VGARNPDQVNGVMKAGEVKLTDQDILDLDTVVG
jgi:aryl-alcohol dehydrogenase-like predicted oxidoreductase